MCDLEGSGCWLRYLGPYNSDEKNEFFSSGIGLDQPWLIQALGMLALSFLPSFHQINKNKLKIFKDIAFPGYVEFFSSLHIFLAYFTYSLSAIFMEGKLCEGKEFVFYL